MDLSKNMKTPAMRKNPPVPGHQYLSADTGCKLTHLHSRTLHQSLYKTPVSLDHTYEHPHTPVLLSAHSVAFSRVQSRSIAFSRNQAHSLPRPRRIGKANTQPRKSRWSREDILCVSDSHMVGILPSILQACEVRDFDVVRWRPDRRVLLRCDEKGKLAGELASSETRRRQSRTVI